MRNRLVKEFEKVAKKALRSPRTWQEVATRVRYERLRKILWRRYGYMP